MRNRKPARLRREKRGVLIIPPTEPAARDEGPRLIPLSAEQNQEHAGKIQHYMNLADIALKLPAKNRTR